MGRKRKEKEKRKRRELTKRRRNGIIFLTIILHFIKREGLRFRGSFLFSLGKRMLKMCGKRKNIEKYVLNA